MSNKSKPTGTIHFRTTSEPIKTATNIANVTDSTLPVLEAGKTASKQDTAAVTVDANAIVADNTTGTSIAAIALEGDTEPAPMPVDTAPDALTATTAPTTVPVTTEPGAPDTEKQTKMVIATEIFKRMKKVKGVTRKEILDAFIVDAKLSKAGASTYYQLIKAKVEKK